MVSIFKCNFFWQLSKNISFLSTIKFHFSFSLVYILYFLLDMVQSIAKHAVKQTVTAFKMQKWILFLSKCAFHHGHYACSSC